MSGIRVGFIGAGNMAKAMAKGFISSGIISSPQNIIASSPISDQLLLDQMAQMGCQVTYNNEEAAAFGDVVLVSVKPNVVPHVLKEINNTVAAKSPLIASVALGVSIKTIEGLLPEGARVIRVMPNTPALVNHGASVFAMGTNATLKDGLTTSSLLKAVGNCDEVSETFLDAITGLSGAGPAYMYLIIEALADGGVKMGLPRSLALKLVTQTMMGAAKMVEETGKGPGQLKDEVCSPGGCTIQGVAALENGGLRAALINAVQDATTRSLLISGAKIP